jgi:glucose dehydrogenase
MTRHKRSIRNALLAATVLAAPSFAAEVTPERLLNPDKEPQNWLMNHRTYDGQRFSPLSRIDKAAASIQPSQTLRMSPGLA